MACKQIHYDVPVIGGKTVGPDEPTLVTLTKTHLLHIIQADPEVAPINICVARIVKCQSGCLIKEYRHDFPICECNTILPPGQYEICIVDEQMPYEDDLVTTLDIILEEISQEMITALMLNK